VQVHIAQRHLLPKLLAEHGLSAEQLAFPREVLEAVASGWTREAGVRRLSQARTLAAFPPCSAIGSHSHVEQHDATSRRQLPRHKLCANVAELKTSPSSSQFRVVCL